jgi:O-antigen/teichoic acid export membrane protein
LGQATFGKYGFISSFYFFFMAFLDLGISVVAIREIAKERNKGEELLSSLITFKLFISILLALSAVAIANIFPFPPDLRLALSFYAPVLIFIALESIQVIFEADLQYEYIALSAFFWRVSSLLFLILAVRLKLGLAFIVLSFLLAEAVKCMVLYFSSRKSVNIKMPTVDIKLWIGMVKGAFPLFITSLLITIIRNIDVMMLTKIKGFAEVGLYLAPYRLCDMALSIPIALMGSVFPLMSKFYKQDFSIFKKIYQKSFDILSACGVILVVLVLVFSDKIIILLFGANFVRSALAFRILIFSTLSVYLGIGSGSLLVAIDKQKATMWFYLLGAPLSIILNLILIPRFGFLGAAISNVTVMILVVSLTFYYVSTKAKISLDTVKLKKAIFAALATSVVLFYLKRLKLFISIPIGVFLYLFLIILIKAIDKDDIVLLFKRKFTQGNPV